MDASVRQLYTFAGFTLDTARARLLDDGEPVALRPKAYDALLYLIEHRGRLVTKEELLQALWPKVVVTDDSLVKCIQEVRAALGEEGRALIRTVPRRGYVFEAAVHEAAPREPPGRAGEPAARDGRGPALASSPARWAVASAAAAALLGAGLGAWRLLENGVDAVPAAASVPGSVRRSDLRSVAVLPFVSISADPGEDYFSDGVTEELLNVLANIPGLHVPSRTSSFVFKGSSADLRTIAAALGVEHVLEGSVRKSGDDVRITAQLIDVATDSHLWSATYDRKLTNVFAIQDEIARNVAAALEVRLLGGELPRASGARTDSTEAHDAYLLGLHHLRTQRSEDLFLARDLFARATALDPAYAAAYADLAIAWLTAYRYGLVEREDALAAAERAVARGLDLDPQLAGLHAAAGLLEQDRGNGAASVAAYRRAIALNPASELAHFGLFNVLGGLARVAEARQTLELALELDPLNGLLNWSMGNVRLGLGDRERAAVHYRRGIEFEPTQPNSYSGLGDVAIVSGRLDEGLRWYLAGLEQDPGQAHMTAIVGLLYRALGDADRARLWLGRGAELFPANDVQRLLRDFEPLVERNEDPAALLAVLRGVPPPALSALGSRLFRKAALATGDLAGTEDFFRRHWPELLAAEPRIDAGNYAIATDVAWLAIARGRQDHAARLLDRVLEIVADPAARPTGPIDWGAVLVETEALALLGRTDDALEAFARAVEGGWRFDWRQVRRDPVLDSIRREPAFEALLARVQADLAEQRERLHEVEQ